MYFSDLFDIDQPEQYDWFNPILELDTLLFVDPFLIFQDEGEGWAFAHDKIMDYFNRAFTLLAQSGNRPGQILNRVHTLMLFPEPKEFRLGYTAKSADGAGAGKGLARKVVSAMSGAIARGLEDIRHFEELGIFVERFNRDRISDVVCNLLKPELIRYTQQVCLDLNIPTQEMNIKHGAFNELRQRWLASKCQVPVDPAGKPILLVPKRFLDELPVLDARNWYDSLDTGLRDDFNLHISGKVKKADILKAAQSNINSYRRWIEREEEYRHAPYDVDVDPMLYVQWQRVATDAASSFPRREQRVINSEEEMLDFVQEVIGYVRHWAENEGGWRLFWRDVKEGKSIPESNMQILFLGMVSRYCEAVGVRIDREVETGTGPVDFAFSGDQRLRILVEMKKLNHGEFWLGLNKQTVEYLVNQRLQDAIYLAIRNSTKRNMEARWKDLDAQAEAVRKETGLNIQIGRIDVMPKLSASIHREPTTLLEGEDEDTDPESGSWTIRAEEATSDPSALEESNEDLA